MKLYDSLTQQKKELVRKEVNIYSCGPTVYNHIHLGNARPVILMDILVRYLKSRGHKPYWVQNITDIDDKIINQALLDHQDEAEVAKKYLASYLEDLKKLNVQLPQKMPLISAYLPQMISYIQKLIKSGFAYEREGNVYFNVAKLEKSYGQLSKQDLEQLQSLQSSLDKKSQIDFTLWKKTSAGKKWDSPWGLGRPGWHTECMVLINTNFKNLPLNIHAGGLDLKFPHHENERAQHLALTQKELADIWFHNGHLTFSHQKMSKSQGNVILVRDFLDLHHPDLLRWIFLTTNYRQPINFSDDLLNQGLGFLKKIQNLRKKMIYHEQLNSSRIVPKKTSVSATTVSAFNKAMDENLNTPQVLSLIEDLIAKANQKLKKSQFFSADQDYHDLKWIWQILGFSSSLETKLSKKDTQIYQAWLNTSKHRNFEQADTYREQLKARDLI